MTGSAANWRALAVLGCLVAAPSFAVDGSCPALLDEVGRPQYGSSQQTPRAVREGQPPSSSPSMGPLRRSSRNPRYFAMPGGRVVYLVGAHTWDNLEDMDTAYPPQPFDFDGYLRFLQDHGLNLIRLWAWEVSKPDDLVEARRTYAAPQPWLRTGPGLDLEGLPKFDLDKLNPDYFARLRSRVDAARERGIYVSVMLFEGWSVQFSPGKLTHPFYEPNNINATGYLKDVRDIDTLRYPQITQMQERYLEAVIDAIDDQGNVLYEIANEAGTYSTHWQDAMLRFVKCYESTRAQQHPIGMTFEHPDGDNATLFASAADWVSPGPPAGDPVARSEVFSDDKVVLVDSDHTTGSGLSDPLWVYRSFFAGHNVLYMDRYFGPTSLNYHEVAAAPAIRAAMGHVRLIASVVDLGAMTPAPQVASSGYALAGGGAVLALAPDSGPLRVDLRSQRHRMRVDWFDVATGHVTAGAEIDGGRFAEVQNPFDGAAVVYLRDHAAARSLSTIEHEAVQIRLASRRYASLSRVLLSHLADVTDLVSSHRRLSLAVSLMVIALLLSLVGRRLVARSRR